PRVGLVAACSAGACIATMFFAERTEAADAFWRERRRTVDRNFMWERLLVGERPTPHAAVYRDTLVHAFEGGGLERLKAQPFPILIQTTALPRGLSPLASAALGIAAYGLEK